MTPHPFFDPPTPPSSLDPSMMYLNYEGMQETLIITLYINNFCLFLYLLTTFTCIQWNIKNNFKKFWDQELQFEHSKIVPCDITRVILQLSRRWDRHFQLLTLSELGHPLYITVATGIDISRGGGNSHELLKSLIDRFDSYGVFYVCPTRSPAFHVVGWEW